MSHTKHGDRWVKSAAGMGVFAVLVVGFPASPASADEGYLVHTDSGASVNIRTGPGTEYPIVGKLASGERVKIFCTRRDRNGALWDSVAAPGGHMVLDALIKTGTNGPVAPPCPESEPAQDTAHAEVVPPTGITQEMLLSAAKSAAAGCAVAVASGLVVDAVIVGSTAGAGIVISGPKMAVECVVGALTPGVGKLLKWWLGPANGIPDMEYPFEFRNPPRDQPPAYTGQPSPTPGPSPIPPVN